MCHWQLSGYGHLVLSLPSANPAVLNYFKASPDDLSFHPQTLQYLSLKDKNSCTKQNTISITNKLTTISSYLQRTTLLFFFNLASLWQYHGHPLLTIKESTA